MINRLPSPRSIPIFLAPAFCRIGTTPIRFLHQNVKVQPLPSPTPFVPDVNTFLSLIGRKLSSHSAKIPDWKALFSLTSTQLKELGIEPPRTRRYLLRWRQKFRDGDFGIGGDAKIVQQGAIPLRVIDIPAPESKRPSSATHTRGTRKVIVNLEADRAVDDEVIGRVEEMKIKGVHIKGLHTITGPDVLPVKGGESGKIAVLKAREGLWEHKRGVKIDGGERRRAEIRSKRRSEERKNSRA